MKTQKKIFFIMLNLILAFTSQGWAIVAISPAMPKLKGRPIYQVGQEYILDKDRRFYRFNQATGENDLVTLKAGSRIRLGEITKTANQRSFWTVTTPGISGNLWAEENQAVKSDTPDLSQSLSVGTNPISMAIEVAANQEKYMYTSRNFSIQPGKRWNPLCTNFLDDQGKLGTWGTAIYNTLGTPRYQNLLNQKNLSDISNICPVFPMLNTDSKKKFWVYFLAAMAQGESSCNPKNHAQGPDETAAGLFQLPLVGHTKAPHNCVKSDMYNALANIRCAFGILDTQIEKYGAIKVNRGQTYWAVLRKDLPDSAKTRRLLALAADSCAINPTAAKPTKPTAKPASPGVGVSIKRVSGAI